MLKELNKNLNSIKKNIETIKENQWKMKTTITETKNILKGINNRTDEAEDKSAIWKTH